MTDEKPITAEQLSGLHLRQAVRIAPGSNDDLAVSGVLVAVQHHEGQTRVLVAIKVDSENTVELNLYPSVPIAFLVAAADK